ncbi:PepSY domain-containing protein [Lentibacillus salinarum]|uniref:PepSY domain-containing protein n=1 Tax=Lentibacillus salinarum TaxID=446820 RepID=A0ABW3ZUB1_9BACI
MKKKIGVVLAVILGLSALGLGMLQSSASEASPKLDQQEIKDLITSQYPGKITELEMEQKGNQTVYEAEIQDDGTEYEIKLDGNTGNVLELDKKFATKDNHEQNSSKNSEDKSDKTNSGQNNDDKKARDDDADNGDKNSSDKDGKDRVELSYNGNSEGKSNTAVISMAEVEDIALSEFSGNIVEMELDEDDDRLYYEIEIEGKNKEAEIEIDAYTGEILVMEIDDM